MAKIEIDLVANTNVFRGLARQNMLLHQCLNELLDNSIASKKGDLFKIEILIEEKGDNVEIYICDDGKGMTLSRLSEALQLGAVPDPDSDRLHEHGFGLKNSLATLTNGNGYWKIWTQAPGEETCSVEGPFGPKMSIEDEDQMPELPFLPKQTSTIVYAQTSKKYLATVQGRGRIGSDLQKLRKWMAEHIGVAYRGYLLQDPKTGDPDGEIRLSIVLPGGKKDSLKVLPIEVPFAKKETTYIPVTLPDGKEYIMEYSKGTIDETKRNQALYGDKLQYYYQGNQNTQGIDIRIGKRVIATGMLSEIWDFTKHNGFNDFVGELLIPNDVPRGMLTTVNNKTDFNLDDDGWGAIFSKLRTEENQPKRNSKETSEKDLRDKWFKILKDTNPEDSITKESTAGIWGSAVRIDVLRERENGKITIYEMKVTSANPQHVYQMKMYWDGLELAGKVPNEAILMVEDYDDKIVEMIAAINSKMSTPTGGSYSFKIEKNKDRGL